MKYLSLSVMALFAQASDMTLENKLTSLKNLARETKQWNVPNMISAIDERRYQLEVAADNQSMNQSEITNEL